MLKFNLPVRDLKVLLETVAKRGSQNQASRKHIEYINLVAIEYRGVSSLIVTTTTGFQGGRFIYKLSGGDKYFLKNIGIELGKWCMAIPPEIVNLAKTNKSELYIDLLSKEIILEGGNCPCSIKPSIEYFSYDSLHQLQTIIQRADLAINRGTYSGAEPKIDNDFVKTLAKISKMLGLRHTLLNRCPDRDAVNLYVDDAVPNYTYVVKPLSL